MFDTELKDHLTRTLLPFWHELKDAEFGGFYGYLGYDLTLDKKAAKGCILNSRLLWFFSNAYLLLKEESILADAKHAFLFLQEHCMDWKNGGVYWSVTYDGRPEDTTKHTYNQAFAVYALSSYYDASGDTAALALAKSLYALIESKCRDGGGYLEAFSCRFEPVENDKLSENGVLAERTMNTLLHVLEAYTELYRVSRDADVADCIRYQLDLLAEQVYNPARRRQEVFFDRDWHSLIDLHSYGHDIETAWLADRSAVVLGDPTYTAKIAPITRALTETVYQKAYSGHSLANEAENGVADNTRVWWVQAEAVVGFLNGWQKSPERTEYWDAALDIWEFIKNRLIDRRPGSEWYWGLDAKGNPLEKPIVEPWKCPYHNGRMCIEVIRRMQDAT